ncbi:hypothetical protein K439DRAFT_1610865 [Ramaria rubella]|nr:hypothetical protein K439DRAFT_1610865 [Ramaria rubella]
MAASHHRRQTSDPFRDNSPSSAHYDRNGPRSAPLPPPKEDMLSAVRESVTVKPVSDPSRSKMGRSYTSNSSGTVTPPRTRRSVSTDSVPPPVDKSGKPPRAKPSKKASMHADTIDRLDHSGVGVAMLHHDGPFDACAPSRNKHKHKAPMMAWGPGDSVIDPLSNIPDFSSDRRLSPLAQTTLTAMSSYDSPYGPPSLYTGSPVGTPGSIPKKRVDALAEAWGMAEPEPFEEFFAGGGDRSAASSIKNGKDGRTTPTSRRAKDARDTYRDYLDDGRPSRTPRTRTTVPPPKPISLPGSRSHEIATSPKPSSLPDAYDPQPPNNSENAPRRSRSLISRIRKMRDAPNVPVTYNEDDEPSESPNTDSPPESFESATTPPARPTHKHQTSFLGRFRSPGGAGGGGVTTTSPVSDSSERSADFVYVDDNREKDLPAPPGDYFGDAISSGHGLGRKTSLMKRFKGVRRATKS